jgi:hypothetical protein
MEKKLTEGMIYRIAEMVVCDWDVDTAIDEVMWLYDNLAKHDKELYQELIWNAESMGVNADGEYNE